LQKLNSKNSELKK